MPEQPVRAVGLEADLGLFQVGLVSRPVRPEIASIIVIFGAVHPVTVSFIIKAHHEVMGDANRPVRVCFKVQRRNDRLSVQQHPQSKTCHDSSQTQSNAFHFF